MIKFTKEKFLQGSFVVFSVVLFDQITKFWVLRPDLVTYCNFGFAFGLARSWYLSGSLAFLVLGVVVYIFIKEQNRDRLFGLSLIVGGGASNVIDRVVRGCVVDFISFGFLQNMSWPPLLEKPVLALAKFPAFNLADAAIAIGTAILILSIISEMKVGQKH